jgi:hypothetical protein
MANKITYADKVGINPKSVHINQVWDDDMNEIKDKHNLNDDRITVLETNTNDVTGVLAYTPIADTYLAFGVSVKINDNTIHHYTRIGDEHVGGPGDLYKIVYDVATDTWGDETLIYTRSGYDSRNITAGYVGTTIFIFFGRYEYGTTTWIDEGYIKSTDDGDTWSGYTVLDTFASSGYATGGFGAICETSVAGTYLMSFYSNDTVNDLNRWGYYKTTNSGTSWTRVVIRTQAFSVYEAEPSFVYIGNSRILVIVRLAVGGTDLYSSSNNGVNFTKVGKIPWCISPAATVASMFYDYKTNKIVGQWLDRNVNKVWTAIGDANAIYHDINGFHDIRITDRDLSQAKNGYASFVNLETITGENENIILCTYSREMTTDTVAHLYQYKVKVY